MAGSYFLPHIIKRRFASRSNFRLTILDPIVADIGEYSCTASNEHGSDKCSCRVVTGGKCLELIAVNQVEATSEPYNFRSARPSLEARSGAVSRH